jgi:hypothetical protein
LAYTVNRQCAAGSIGVYDSSPETIERDGKAALAREPFEGN